MEDYKTLKIVPSRRFLEITDSGKLVKSTPLIGEEKAEVYGTLKTPISAVPSAFLPGEKGSERSRIVMRIKECVQEGRYDFSLLLPEDLLATPKLLKETLKNFLDLPIWYVLGVLSDERWVVYTENDPCDICFVLKMEKGFLKILQAVPFKAHPYMDYSSCHSGGSYNYYKSKADEWISNFFSNLKAQNLVYVIPFEMTSTWAWFSRTMDEFQVGNPGPPDINFTLKFDFKDPRFKASKNSKEQLNQIFHDSLPDDVAFLEYSHKFSRNTLNVKACFATNVRKCNILY